jgi:hypothetical protein
MKKSKIVELVLKSITSGSIYHPKDKEYIEDKKMTPYSALKCFDEFEDGEEAVIGNPVVVGGDQYLVTIKLEKIEDKLIKEAVC